MIIELNLAQAEEILNVLNENPKKAKTINLVSAMSIIKQVIKHETEIQIEEIDRLIKRISDNGNKNLELTDILSSTKIQLTQESLKTKYKYFDEGGKEK